MIIRCKNCVSAFAVDDAKVANRKFAFTCPKCGIENIIDNRQAAGAVEFSEPVSDNLFDEIPEQAAPAVKTAARDIPEENFFPGEPAAEKTIEDEFAAFEEELPGEKPAPAKKQPLNLDIEEAPVEPAAGDFTFDEDVLFEEPTAVEKPAKKPVPSAEPSEDFLMDELDLELAGEAEKPGVESAEPDFSDIDLNAELADFEIAGEKKPGAPVPERDKKLTDQEEIDAMFAASSPEEGAKDEDITVDLDNLDIEFEEAPQPKVKEPVPAEEDITIDIDSLDIEIEEPEPVTVKTGAAKKAEALEEPLFDLEIPGAESAETVKAGKAPAGEESLFDFEIAGEEEFEPAAKGKKHAEPDEDITLDMESLDIDIEEPVHESIKNLPERKGEVVQQDEGITLDVDSLDIEIDESAFEAQPEMGELPEEDIEIDLDSLDFENEEAWQSAAGKPKKVREIMQEQAGQGEEEDIRLNLDELDIDIDEISEKDMDFVRKSGKAPAGRRKGIIEEAPEGEDESITIDLDTLDIEVAESAPIVEREISEEDEKLTIEDAGMTLDELTTSERKEMHLDLEEEDEIRLTLDEVAPNMQLEEIGEVVSAGEPLLVDTIEELPEISLEEMEPAAETRRREYKRIVPEEDLDLEPSEEGISAAPARKFGRYGRVPVESVHRQGRATLFTIDFSLKYSRIGALLRLLQIYTLSMIPHFVVLNIYTVLSSILGFINQIVVLSTGKCVEDFAQIAENTLRYYLYIGTCLTGIVEDRPEYAGRERIDHQMQLNITYPFKYSKVLAALRISVIGIYIVTLPHLVMMLFISCFMPFVYLAGIIWVIITGRWPNPLFQVLTMYFRYLSRISSFMIGLTDQYPPFKFE